MKISKMVVDVDNPRIHGLKPPRCKLPSYSHLDFYTMLDFPQHNLSRPINHPCHNQVNRKIISRSLSSPCFYLSNEQDLYPRVEIVYGHSVSKVKALVAEVAIALASGVKPEPMQSGLGGAYYLNKIAVVKPVDEEPLAINNPKGFSGRMLGQPGIKRSIKVGDTGHRELAAYLLDHDNFAKVPPSAVVKISHVAFHVNNSELISTPPSKIASLQRFVDHESDAGDLGPSGFSVSSVHRIGILDVRLLNLDRHSGNILVKLGYESYSVGSAELVPIDHGLCLPESLEDPYFEWLHWPQSLIPFSDFEVEYISNLDPFRDAEILRSEVPAIRESSVRVLVLCTVFLKRAVAAGLCLADIGEMMSREFCGGEENWSVLEKICVNAKANLSSAANFSFGCVEENLEMFEFDNESTDQSNHRLDVQKCFGKPPKVPRFSPVKSMIELTDTVLLCTSNEDDQKDHFIPDTAAGDINHKMGAGFTRSVSFSAQSSSHERREVSFGEMRKEEWESFLDIFEGLLPEIFEERSNGSSKQRLGTSCEF